MKLSLKEAAEALGISLTTARRWIKTGRLKATMREGPYGPEYVVTQEELERARRKNPTPVTVIVPEPKEEQGITVPREWLIQAMRQALEQAITSAIGQVARGMEENFAALVKSLEETLAKQWTGVEQGLKRELEELRAELAATRELLRKQEEESQRAEAERDRLLEERDRRLVEEIRQALQERKKPWWKFW
ncbi:MAG: helix-turn-helix domain-containing protein [Thermanaeromonas sp.]|uniref:helix-turn-helix domain-containing protein n=1 Tax=Thermanaeromonas sp. TaxID=2003697 RepID=UPI0024383E11|nr:helix-turn-helix domain-containing protein [Thermanaeromonas sp.]MCG0278539.1 helix-turn-helix domain-containing protein [Thermanaeromonas sp.]